MKAGSEGRHERTGEGDSQQDHGQEHEAHDGGHAPGQSERGFPPVLQQGAGVGRDERGREGSLGKEVAKQVRDPEGDLEGVGVPAIAEEGREHLLADQPEQPRDHGQRGDEPDRPQGAGGRGAAFVDLGNQGRYTNLLLRLRGGEDWDITHRP